jgi:hypothetical protein
VIVLAAHQYLDNAAALIHSERKQALGGKSTRSTSPRSTWPTATTATATPPTTPNPVAPTVFPSHKDFPKSRVEGLVFRQEPIKEPSGVQECEVPSSHGCATYRLRLVCGNREPIWICDRY